MIIARLKNGKFKTYNGISSKASSGGLTWTDYNDKSEFCYVISFPDFTHYSNGSTTFSNMYINYFNVPGTLSQSFTMVPNVNVDSLVYRIPVNSDDTQLTVKMGIIHHNGYDYIGFNIYENSVFKGTAPSFTDYSGEFEFIYEIGTFYGTKLSSRDAAMGYSLCCYGETEIHILKGNASNDNKVIGYFGTTNNPQISTRGTIFPIINTDQSTSDAIDEISQVIQQMDSDIDERFDTDEEIIQGLGGDIGEIRENFVTR